MGVQKWEYRIGSVGEGVGKCERRNGSGSGSCSFLGLQCHLLSPPGAGDIPGSHTGDTPGLCLPAA